MNTHQNCLLKSSIACFVIVILIVFGICVAFSAPVPAGPPSPSTLKLLTALNKVEASGVKNTAVLGDNGKALGPFQIHREYWRDATEFGRIGGKYSDCTNYAYSVTVVHAYWRRYASDALKSQNLEALARIHNGGPSGASNPKTLGYWRKVQKHLTQN